jgi:hypothetical protein
MWMCLFETLCGYSDIGVAADAFVTLLHYFIMMHGSFCSVVSAEQHV